MLYIFDMGGVVTDTFTLNDKICRVLGISIEQLREYGADPSIDFTKEPNALYSLYSSGKITTEEFWGKFSEKSGIKVTTDWLHWLFHPVLNEKTVEIVKALRKNGNRVVCGTNTVTSHYLNHMERGDYAYFDQTYSSCHMGVSKPDPAFWEIIMKAENVQPKDCVFIDDKKLNCDAAAAMGIHAVQFTSAEQLAQDLGIRLSDC